MDPLQRQGGSVPAATLLDLPDDLLSIVLSYLGFPPDCGLRGRTLRDGPPALALALTCKRLCRVFRNGMRTIDGLYPHSYDRHPLGLSDIWLSVHFAAILRLAGDNLRNLRLLPHCALPMGTAGRSWCTKLEEVAYARDEFSEAFELAVFNPDTGSTNSLRRVCIFDPRGVLHLLENICCLQELHLTAVRPRYVHNLTDLISRSGKQLKALSVGFDATLQAQEYCANPKDVVWCISVVTQCVEKALKQGELPMLTLLHFASAREELLDKEENQVGGGERADERAFAHKLLRLLKRIKSACKRTADSPRTSSVRKLSLRSSSELVEPLIEVLEKLMTKHISVELCVRGTALFSDASQVPTECLLKSFLITQPLLRLLPNEQLKLMKTVTRIGIGREVLGSYRTADVRAQIFKLIASMGPSLQVLCVPELFRSIRSSRHACDFVADMLEAVPSVKSLEIPTEFVAMAVNATTELQFTRMCYAMRNVRILRIRRCVTPGASRGRLFHCVLPFAKGLPSFLKTMVSCCPLLEFVLLEATTDFEPLENYESMEEEATLSLQAVADLEAALPQVDASSVRTQLQVWLNRAM